MNKRIRDQAARVIAIAEVCFLLLASSLLAGAVGGYLGSPDADAFLYGEGTEPDFLRAAVAQLGEHVVRYGLLIGAILAIGWIRGRRSLAAYGVTRGRHSLGQLVSIGIVLGMIVMIPAAGLRLVHDFIPLGEGTRFWVLQEQVGWDLSFWLYMAVSSFLVVPLVEEFVARGYVLTRFMEDSTIGGSLILMATLFALAHGQYHKAEPLAIGTLITLIGGSVLWGYALIRTGSLIPCIVGHMLVNVPLTPPFQLLLVLGGIVVLWVVRRAIAGWAADLSRVFRSIDDLPATLAGVLIIAVFLLSLRSTDWLPLVWLTVFGVAALPGLWMAYLPRHQHGPAGGA